MMNRFGRAAAAALLCTIVGGAALVPGGAAAESVFDAAGFPGRSPAGFGAVGAGAGFGMAAGIAVSASQDTVETFDVAIEEQEERMSIYKEVAIVAIVSGIVGYAVYSIIKSDDTEEKPLDGGSGKPTPFAAPLVARFALSRSR